MAVRRSPRIAAKQAATASAVAALKEQRIARAAAYFGPIDPNWKIRCGAWVASSWEPEVIETYYLTLAEYLETGAKPSRGFCCESAKNHGRYEAGRCLKKVELEAELILLNKAYRSCLSESIGLMADGSCAKHMVRKSEAITQRIKNLKNRAMEDYGIAL